MTRLRALDGRWPLAVVLVLGAVNFVFGLGASSLFIDEVDAWRHAAGPVGDVLNSVRVREVSPPAYFVALNGWRHLFGDSVTALRLPSALAATAGVGVVWLLALRVGGRGAALLAAALAALSPVMVEYAQQARPYAWAMLELALAVALTLSYVDSRRRHVAPLWGALVATVAAAWTTYTAWPAIAVLVVWLLIGRDLPLRARALFGAAVGVACGAVLPLLHDQLARGHHQGAIIEPARVASVARVFGAPFDRVYNVLSEPLQIAAAALVIAGAAVTACGRGDRRRLIAALALAPPLLLVAVALCAQSGLLFARSSEVVISRYAVVAVPFMLTALAVAIVRLPRPAGAALAAAALALAALGSVRSHRSEARYPDTAGAMRLVAAGWQRGDLLVARGYAATGANLDYYSRHLLGVNFTRPPRGTPPAAVTRVWTVGEPEGDRAAVAAYALALGFKLIVLRDFRDGALPIRATLIARLPAPAASERLAAERVARTFAAAAARGDGRRACALLTAAARRLAGGQACAAAVRARAHGPRMVRAVAVGIDGARATVTLSVAGRPEQVLLNRASGRWRVAL